MYFMLWFYILCMPSICIINSPHYIHHTWYTCVPNAWLRNGIVKLISVAGFNGYSFNRMISRTPHHRKQDGLLIRGIVSSTVFSFVQANTMTHRSSSSSSSPLPLPLPLIAKYVLATLFLPHYAVTFYFT